MVEKMIYLKMWKPDGDGFKWIGFNTTDTEDLVDREVIDLDMLGYAMNDQAAFNKTMEELEKSPTAYSIKNLLDKYLEYSNEPIRIDLT